MTTGSGTDRQAYQERRGVLQAVYPDGEDAGPDESAKHMAFGPVRHDGTVMA